MSIQEMVSSGQVDQTASTSMLEALVGYLNFQIVEMKQTQYGAMGQAKITRYQGQIDKAQTLINARQGMDGMTLLTA